MKLVYSIWVWLLLLVPVESFKILVWPAEWSHWINMKIIIEELHRRNHTIHVMQSSAYTDFLKDDFDKVTFIPFNVSFKSGFHLESHDRVIQKTKLGSKSEMTFWNRTYAMITFWLEQLAMRNQQCETLMASEEILKRLNHSDYDLVLADPSVPCGELLAAKLRKPFVYSVRTLPAEMHFVMSQTPVPVAYVPMINTAYSDKMNLFQRTWNMINYIVQYTAVTTIMSYQMDPIVHKYVDPQKSYLDLVSESSMWLIRTDFSFEYPRPMMPNMEFIGGFHCKEAKTIGNDRVRRFVEEATDGLVIFSMGSMVSEMSDEKANMVAETFAKLAPLRVLWRYNEKRRPKKLGSNTLIQDWIPQNDVMGHNNTKLFITHGGTNGLYEAIFHAVPMLGLPLLVDQYDNMLRITDRGAGKTLDITDLEQSVFRDSIKEIISNPSYKEAVSNMSRLHRLKQNHPLDVAIYHIEYVIETDGAHNLRAQSHNLVWYQYFMLDSILLIFTTVAGAIFLQRLVCQYTRRNIK
jgi:glucuronosyltransferase